MMQRAGLSPWVGLVLVGMLGIAGCAQGGRAGSTDMPAEGQGMQGMSMDQQMEHCRQMQGMDPSQLSAEARQMVQACEAMMDAHGG